MFRKSIKSIFKYSGILLLALVIVFLLVGFLIQQPKIQTWLVHKATSFLSEKTGTNISVGKVGIKFFKTISIQDVYLEDMHGDTLAYIGSLDTRIQYFNPFKSALHFNSLSLENVRANIYRNENDSTFNYQFLLDAFQSSPKTSQTEKKKDTKKEKQPFDFNIRKIYLADIALDFDDREGGEGHSVRLGSLDLSAKNIDLPNQKIEIRSIKIDRPKYVLNTYKKGEKKEKEGTPFQVDIGWILDVKKLQIKKGQFGMHNHTVERNYGKNGFEFNWFDVDGIQLKAKDILWDKHIAIDLNQLAARSDANNINLTALQAGFSMTDSTMQADNFKAAYNQTSLDADAKLNFKDFKAFSEFLQEVHIEADIRRIQTHGEDVGVWAKEAIPYVPNATVSGYAYGTISNLTAKNLTVKAEERTTIVGDAKIKGLPDAHNMTIEANLKQVSTHSDELKKIIHYVKLPPQIDSLGHINLSGDFIGTIHDFRTNVDIETDAGKLWADTRLILPGTGIPAYSGKVKSDKINLSKLLGDNKLNQTGFDLEIDGSGFDLNQINGKVKGFIKNFQYNYYTYEDIYVNGYVDNQKFEGEAQLTDDCAVVDFKGLVNFEDPEKPVYKFYTKVNSADLQMLNLIPNRLIVSIEGNFEFEGKDIDNLIGRASLSDIHLIDNNMNVSLSDLVISLDKFGDYKEYKFESEDIKGYMKGFFDPIKLPASLQFYFAQHTTLLKAPGIESFDKLLAAQDLEMNITIAKDIGIAAMIDPKIKSFSEISINGNYNNDLGKIDLNVNIDSLTYDNLKFTEFKANAFDRNDSLIITSSLGSLQSQGAKINNIRFGSTSNLRGFYSRLRVEEEDAKNNLELITIVNFPDDSIKIRFPRSRIKINNKNWTIASGNNILIVDSILQLNNFALQQGEQRITISNRQNLSDAFVKIENLNIADLTQIIDSTEIIKNGILHADIRLKDVLKNPEIEGDITLQDLDVYNEKIDMINLTAKLSDTDKLLDLSGYIQDDDYSVRLGGKYNLEKNHKSPIDLDADFDKLSLKFLGFPIILGDEISDLKANVRGKINVSGSFKDIALDGRASILDTASLKINFLGTGIRLANTDVVLKPRSIELFGKNSNTKKIRIFDFYNNSADLEAKLEHRSFKNFSVSAVITSEKFNFLNTTYKDNQDFFGRVFASGDVLIEGPFEDITMNITATTLPNTEFNIVVEGASDDQLYDFVKFTDRSIPKDTVTIEAETPSASSLNLELNVIATPDAQLKLYLDYVKNDVIRARGSGELQLIINPNSMQMFGEYVASSGDYLFSQQDIINKKFNIRDGSTISWSGDIMEAKMNVDAFYSARVNMNDVVDSMSNLRNRRFPVDVILNIGGTLAETDINFTLAPSKGQSNTPDELQAILDRVNSNPAQTNTQAFSLILFNRFLNLQSTEGSTNQTGNLGLDMAVTTLSEFFNAKISEYVNDALSMLIPGAEVAISQGTDNTGIRVTQKLSNDRLIINLGGDVQYGAREQIRLQENNTGFIGDVEIEYLITEDGRIRAKAYSRYDNTIIRLENESYLRSGIGITYQKEVDKFFDLFKINKEKRKRKKSQKALEKEKTISRMDDDLEDTETEPSL